jgi:tRNA threonylcarbamoyladenosine biosynthesis protein TsaE
LSHLPILETRQWHWANEAECATTAARLAARPAMAHATLELEGPLGAGKTTLVRHLLRALGVSGRIKSPTYAVVEPYEVMHAGQPLVISHFDFYRFTDPREWEDAGFREIFTSPGLKLCEWAENAGPLRPRADLLLRIEPQDDDSRRVTALAFSPVGQALLR